MLNKSFYLRIQNISLKKFTFTSLAIFSFISLAFINYINIIGKEQVSAYNAKHSMYTLLFDLIFLLAIVIFISVKIFKKWANKTSLIKNSRLQSRIIFIFSLISSIPTIIIAIFSALFFYYGIQSWFTERIRTAITESVEVANAYVNEHQKLIGTDASGLANNLIYLFRNVDFNSKSFNSYLSKQANDRSFIEAVIFQNKPFKIISQSSLSIFSKIENLERAIQEANDNIVIIREIDHVKALVKLDVFPGNIYLMVSRLIDPKVIEHRKKTLEAYNEYQNLNRNILKKQIQFYLSFLLVSLILVLASIWSGILLASRIVKPLFSLVEATEKIQSGNYSVKVVEGTENDEISVLSKAFNLMTLQLDLQRSNLIEANKKIDERRHFSETVILGVSSGIIVLTLNKKISMINPQAKLILEVSEDNSNMYLSQICPEIDELLDNESSESFINIKINIFRHNKSITLLVRIITEIFNKEALGYIITLDDITQLIIAERNFAWSNVAKRIAHEIKNPLTPIHLAAQRLYRKYSHEVLDSITFTKYTSTIIRNVTQIGKMVEEFVLFARMPSPKLSIEDVNKIIQEVVFSRECLDLNIQYVVNCNQEKINIYCDREQIAQVMTNIFKNAEESFEQLESIKSKKIEVNVLKSNDYVIITIEDNGSGFPQDLFHRISEPYLTSKKNGNGLGLAIVKKIIDDHEAAIEFINVDNGGAIVKMVFKSKEKDLKIIK